MEKQITNTSSRSISNPYKELEFLAFLELLKEEQRPNWTVIAQGLGVGREQLIAWRNHPKARELIQSRIDEAYKGMKKAGAKDWKMYQYDLKLHGVSAGDIGDLPGSEDAQIAGVILYKPNKYAEED